MRKVVKRLLSLFHALYKPFCGEWRARFCLSSIVDMLSPLEVLNATQVLSWVKEETHGDRVCFFLQEVRVQSVVFLCSLVLKG